MKKLLSLSLMLSLGLATISPALNAAQTMRQRVAGAMPSMPAWTKSPGFQAAKKWWRAGRNINALNPQERKAFTALKTKVGIGTVVAILTAIAGVIYTRQPKLEITGPTGFILPWERRTAAKELYDSLPAAQSRGDRIALVYERYGKTEGVTPEEIMRYSGEIAEKMPPGTSEFGLVLSFHHFLFDVIDLLSPKEVAEAIDYGRSLNLTDHDIRAAFNRYLHAMKLPSPSKVKSISEAMDRTATDIQESIKDPQPRTKSARKR